MQICQSLSANGSLPVLLDLSKSPSLLNFLPPLHEKVSDLEIISSASQSIFLSYSISRATENTFKHYRIGKY